MVDRSRQMLSRIHYCAAAVLLAIGSAPSVAVSQTAPTIAPGTKVRAKATGAGPGWIEGDLVRVTSDTVVIRDPTVGDSARLAASSLTRFEVSRGRGSGTLRGGLLGFRIGAGAGVLLGMAALAESCSGFCPAEVGPSEILAAAAIVGSVGAGIGALIGSASRIERWQRIRPWRTSVRLGPIGGGGVRIGIALRL